MCTSTLKINKCWFLNDILMFFVHHFWCLLIHFVYLDCWAIISANQYQLALSYVHHLQVLWNKWATIGSHCFSILNSHQPSFYPPTWLGPYILLIEWLQPHDPPPLLRRAPSIQQSNQKETKKLPNSPINPQIVSMEYTPFWWYLQHVE